MTTDAFKTFLTEEQGWTEHELARVPMLITRHEPDRNVASQK